MQAFLLFDQGHGQQGLYGCFRRRKQESCLRSFDVAIYYFPRSESSEEWVRLEEYDIEKDGGTGALVVYFHAAVETRYLKVSSIWDDRDVDNQSVFAYVTFTNAVSYLFRVWTLSTSHTESYEYDAVGNRVSLNSDGP